MLAEAQMEGYGASSLVSQSWTAKSLSALGFTSFIHSVCKYSLSADSTWQCSQHCQYSGKTARCSPSDTYSGGKTDNEQMQTDNVMIRARMKKHETQMSMTRKKRVGGKAFQTKYQQVQRP